MIAYIFKKDTRVIINKVNNPVWNTDDMVYSSAEVYVLTAGEDFIVTNNVYNFGDVLPAAETNKSIKNELEMRVEALENLQLIQEGLI